MFVGEFEPSLNPVCSLSVFVMSFRLKIRFFSPPTVSSSCPCVSHGPHGLKDNCGSRRASLSWLIRQRAGPHCRHDQGGVWSIEHFLRKPLFIFCHTLATDKFGIEKIKGARYLPLLTGPSSDYACLHRRRQGLDTCAGGQEEKGRKTQTEPAFCRPQGRQSL